MDIGIFISSGRRLKVWLVTPPLIMVVAGLGSLAWQQRADWQLTKTKALAEVLPGFIEARREAADLAGIFHRAGGGGLASEDQLGSFLQDMALRNDFVVGSVSVVDRAKQQQLKALPVLYAVVEGTGDLMATQLYINKVKAEQRLLSVDSIRVGQPTDSDATAGQYEVTIVFELLLLDGTQAFAGGSQ